MDSCNCGRRPMGMPYAGRITPASGCRAGGTIPSAPCNPGCGNQPALYGNTVNTNQPCGSHAIPASAFPGNIPAPAPSSCGDAVHCHGPLAMAYVPWQIWNETYPLDRALVRGTIFPELDQPFVMGRCR